MGVQTKSKSRKAMRIEKLEKSLDKLRGRLEELKKRDDDDAADEDDEEDGWEEEEEEEESPCRPVRKRKNGRGRGRARGLRSWGNGGESDDDDDDEEIPEHIKVKMEKNAGDKFPSQRTTSSHRKSSRAGGLKRKKLVDSDDDPSLSSDKPVVSDDDRGCGPARPVKKKAREKRSHVTAAKDTDHHNMACSDVDDDDALDPDPATGHDLDLRGTPATPKANHAPTAAQQKAQVEALSTTYGGVPKRRLPPFVPSSGKPLPTPEWTKPARQPLSRTIRTDRH